MPTYIYPPRAATCIPRDEATALYSRLGWIGQLKVNDSHCMLDYNGLNLSAVWDRHGGRLTHDFTQLQPDLDLLGKALPDWIGRDWAGGRTLFDGGLMHSRHPAIKNVIFIWDVLVQGGRSLIGTTYGERWRKLKELAAYSGNRFLINGRDVGSHITPRIVLSDCVLADEYDAAWQTVEAVNGSYKSPLLEGLVFKNLAGKLKPGLRPINNADWMGKSRVETRRHAF